MKPLWSRTALLGHSPPPTLVINDPSPQTGLQGVPPMPEPLPLPSTEPEPKAPDLRSDDPNERRAALRMASGGTGGVTPLPLPSLD